MSQPAKKETDRMSAEPVLRTLRLEAILPSTTNPRKHFDEERLKELTESVASVGVLQPILCRPLPEKTKNGYEFEVVAGHRRHLAAAKAGLEEIPAMVRELDDKQVLEIQLIENVQREDLTPGEECRGYKQLVKDHGYTVAELAEKIDRSMEYVYRRLRLAELPNDMIDALDSGELKMATALLIAGLPDAKVRRKAFKTILAGRRTWSRVDGGEGHVPYSTAAARELIQTEYMLLLSNVPWDVDDADLVPKAGSCTACPKLSGNQRALFGDFKRHDLCTDKKCFDKKLEADWERRKAAAQEIGVKVLSQKEGEKALYWDSPYTQLDHNEWIQGAMQTYRQVLNSLDPPADIQRYLARHPENGKPIELVKSAALAKLLKARGVTKGYTPSESDRRFQRAERERRQLELRIRDKVLEACVTKAESIDSRSRSVWETVFNGALNALRQDGLKVILGRRELKPGKIKSQYHTSVDYRGPLRAHAEKLSKAQLQGLCVEMLTLDPYGHGFDEDSAKLLGVNVVAAKRQARSEATKAKKEAG